jgi:hypothetical protein
MDISHITGQCRCGAVSYRFPVPPSIDLNSSDVSQYLKDRIMPPSGQKYPERGVRPNSNRWKGNHCHCAACRQTAGALMVDWVNIPTEYVTISRNGPTGKYRASDHATREFVSMTLGTLCISSEPLSSAKHAEPHSFLLMISTRIRLTSQSRLLPSRMSLTI